MSTEGERLARRADNIRDAIAQKVNDEEVMKLIDELVELEIEIEKNCNQ